MFGFLFLIPKFFMYVKRYADAEHESKEWKKMAIREGKPYYWDSNKISCHIENDMPFGYMHLDNGDVYEINPYTLSKIRNISEDNRKKIEAREKELAIRNGDRFYKYEGNINHAGDKIKGVRYKNICNGNIYVKRRINYKIYYLNISTGMYEFVDVDSINKTGSIYFDINGDLICKVPYSTDAVENEISYLNKEQIKKRNNGYDMYGGEWI